MNEKSYARVVSNEGVRIILDTCIFYPRQTLEIEMDVKNGDDYAVIELNYDEAQRALKGFDDFINGESLPGVTFLDMKLSINIGEELELTVHDDFTALLRIMDEDDDQVKALITVDEAKKIYDGIVAFMKDHEEFLIENPSKAVKKITSTNDEKLAELTAKASHYLEKNYDVVMSHSPVITNITVSLLEQMLDEVGSEWQLLISRKEDGSIRIARESHHVNGIEDVVVINPNTKTNEE